LYTSSLDQNLENVQVCIKNLEINKKKDNKKIVDINPYLSYTIGITIRKEKMAHKLDYYTWTKQMIAKSTHPKKLKKLFIKRYGTRNVPLLRDILEQFQVVGKELI